MGLTTLVWLCTFAVLALLSFRRASWGIALYLLVFYVDPNFWWWGGPIRDMFGMRLSLTAALILTVAVLRSGLRLRPQERKVFLVLLLYGLNATVVHVLFASNPERSANNLDLLWKNIGLLLLIVASIKDRVDWRIFIYSIVIGSLYIGYELAFNQRGGSSAGRLERSIASGVGDSNYVAGFLSLAVPLAGALLLLGKKWEKLLALVMLVLVCDTIVLCNSRGGFLALLAGGAWLLLTARGRARRYAITGLLLGVLAGIVLVRDERIVERFLTTFSPAEERATTATSRLEYWAAGSRMLRDHPLGLGGEAAFKSDAGFKYIQPLGEVGYRAIHNGYLDVACAWGVQGAALYGLAICLAWRILRKAVSQASRRADWKAIFWGRCIEAALVTQLVSAMFLSSFDGEWFFWTMALAIGFERIHGTQTWPAKECAIQERVDRQPLLVTSSM